MDLPEDDRPDPVFRESFRTENADEAEALLSAVYADVTIAAPTRDRPFAFRHDTVEADRIAVNRQVTTAPYVLAGAPLDRVTVASGSSAGVIEVVGGPYDHAALSVDGTAALAPLGCDLDVYVSPGVDIDLVTLDVVAFERYAAAAIGIDPGAFEFTGLVPVSPAADTHWRATVTHVRDDLLAQPEIARHPLILDSAFRALAAAALSTFPNTMHEPRRGPRASVSPARLREVLDHLDTHADHPLSLAALAELAGAPP